jgi:hypothetical protein
MPNGWLGQTPSHSLEENRNRNLNTRSVLCFKSKIWCFSTEPDLFVVNDLKPYISYFPPVTGVTQCGGLCLFGWWCWTS